MFGRPIGQNQGVQFPIARAYTQMRAAELMVHEAAALLRGRRGLRRRGQHGQACSPPRRPGPPPTCACRPMAASASPRSIDIERKFRETRLYKVAPISTNLILSYIAEHVLGLPRSY